MKLVICVDERYGMSFLGRRQSMDAAVQQRILALTEGSRLWMSPYSAKQFAPAQLPACEDFLQKAGQGEYCLVETEDIAPWIDRVEAVIVYHWNRHYPSDLVFPVELFEKRWKRVSCWEFAGIAHERITEEVYIV